MVTETMPNVRERSSIPAETAYRDESLAERFYALLSLPDDRLEAALAEFVRAEDELPEPARYEATLARLRAWLELDREDAFVLARAYERATASFTADFAARRIEAERAVIMNGMSFDEFRALAGILPWLRRPEYLVPALDACEAPAAALAVA